MSKAIEAMEAIEDLFLGAYGHTVKLEYMEGEDKIHVIVAGVEGQLAKGTCFWGMGDDLGETIERVIALAQSA